jgi:hypothetical protein
MRPCRAWIRLTAGKPDFLITCLFASIFPPIGSFPHPQSSISPACEWKFAPMLPPLRLDYTVRTSHGMPSGVRMLECEHVKEGGGP